MSDKPKLSLRMLVPVAVSLSMAWLFLALVILSKVESAMFLAPFEEPTNGRHLGVLLESPSPYLNTLAFLGAVLAGSAFVIVFLKFFKRFIRAFVVGALWLAAFSVSSFYALLCSRALLPGSNAERILLPIAAVTATVAAYVSASKKGILSLFSCGIVGAGAGVTLGSSMPFWTAIVLLVSISAYDVLAVLRGHLGALKEQELESLRGFVVEYGGLMIGLGDIFFYALLTSFATLRVGLLAGVGGTLGILAGYVLTLKLLERRGMLPGLPAPILIGLALAMLFGYF